MKINHNNKDYLLNVERAIELGVLTHEIKPKSGDVIKSTSGYTTLLVVKTWSGRWEILGINGGLQPYCNEYSKIEDYYKGDSWILIGNIEEQISELIKNPKASVS